MCESEKELLVVVRIIIDSEIFGNVYLFVMVFVFGVGVRFVYFYFDFFIIIDIDNICYFG